MRGLNRREFWTIEEVSRGRDPPDEDTAVFLLTKRGLLSEERVKCGAPWCPGHNIVAVTKAGRMVYDIMRRLLA